MVNFHEIPSLPSAKSLQARGRTVLSGETNAGIVCPSVSLIILKYHMPINRRPAGLEPVNNAPSQRATRPSRGPSHAAARPRHRPEPPGPALKVGTLRGPCIFIYFFLSQ